MVRDNVTLAFLSFLDDHKDVIGDGFIIFRVFEIIFVANSETSWNWLPNVP